MTVFATVIYCLILVSSFNFKMQLHMFFFSLALHGPTGKFTADPLAGFMVWAEREWNE